MDLAKASWRRQRRHRARRHETGGDNWERHEASTNSSTAEATDAPFETVDDTVAWVRAQAGSPWFAVTVRSGQVRSWPAHVVDLFPITAEIAGFSTSPGSWAGRWYGRSAGRADGEGASVTAVRRFGSASNL